MVHIESEPLFKDFFSQGPKEFFKDEESLTNTLNPGVSVVCLVWTSGRVSVVLKRNVGGSHWRFDNLSRSHLQGQRDLFIMSRWYLHFWLLIKGYWSVKLSKRTFQDARYTSNQVEKKQVPVNVGNSSYTRYSSFLFLATSSVFFKSCHVNMAW